MGYETVATIVAILSLLAQGGSMVASANAAAKKKREAANAAQGGGAMKAMPPPTADKFRVGDSTQPNASQLPDLPQGKSLQDILAAAPQKNDSPQVPAQEQGYTLGIKSMGGDAPKADEYKINETLMQPTGKSASAGGVSNINQYASAASTLLSMYEALKGPGAPQAPARQVMPQQIPSTANQFILR